MARRPSSGQWITQPMIIRPAIRAVWLSLPARTLVYPLRMSVEASAEDKSKREQRKQTIVLYRP